jgi:hypothetical protein
LMKRILAALTILISVVGLLLSIAAGVGVWMVKAPVTAKATYVFDRVETALDVASQGLDHVKTSLARAAERLEAVKEEQRKIAKEPRTGGMVRRLMARTVQQRVAPEFSDAHEHLHTVAEAAVVVNTVLEDVGNFPMFSVTGLEMGDLTEMNNRLTQVESSAWEMTRLLGESGSDADGAEAGLSRIERTLDTMRGLLATYEPRLTQVRQQTEQVKSRTLAGILPAAIVITFICFWIAVSQVSLMIHAWSWWRHAGKDRS